MRLHVLLLAAVVSIGSVDAQVLSDFSAFDNPASTVFSGSWSSSGGALGSFSQGAGVYNVQGATTDAFSGVSVYFLNGAQDALQPLDLGLNRSLSLSLMKLPSNAATSLTITLADDASSTHFATAVFDLTAFTESQYLTSVAQLTADAGFSWSSVQSFSISGAMTGGTSALNLSFDSLSATAVPEPSTYAAMLGTMVLGFVGYRRYRRK